jgi:hypothetical protein
MAAPRPPTPASMPVAPPAEPEPALPPNMRRDAAGHLRATRREPATRNGNGHPSTADTPSGQAAGTQAIPTNGHAAAPRPNDEAAGARSSAQGERATDGPPAAPAGCTAPQLRRFIKSRSWVPMHELRRRFAINGGEDDVTPVAVEGATIFVGLPAREGRLLGELFQAGDIGYELSLDPCTPIVIGVYPMRPVPRH